MEEWVTGVDITRISAPLRLPRARYPVTIRYPDGSSDCFAYIVHDLLRGVGNDIGGGELVAWAETPAHCYDGDSCVAGGLDIGSGVTYHYGVSAVGACTVHDMLHHGGIGLKGKEGTVTQDCAEFNTRKECAYEFLGSILDLVRCHSQLVSLTVKSGDQFRDAGVGLGMQVYVMGVVLKEH